jgi:hypothetical protein
MVRPILIVMAAGIGSRYGGLKQMDPVGPSGELVIDYSIYDALRAGFGKVVLLLRPELEVPFRDKVGRSIEAHLDTVYVFQELDDVPLGFQVPAGRKKPWGTGHAVLSCRPYVDGPFAVINADDFYGAEAFGLLAGHLAGAEDRDGLGDYAMVGYRLSQTLSDFGQVARGVCGVSPDGDLIDIREVTRIERTPGGARYTQDGLEWRPLSGEEIVSLNTWGFTPSIFEELMARFPSFLESNEARILSAEYFLPDVVDDLLRERRAHVRVMTTREQWFGVTYRDDMPRVQAAIRRMIAAGAYPQNLWSGAQTRAGLPE